MRKRLYAIALVFSLIAASLGYVLATAQPAAADVQPDATKPIRGVFYYPWFGSGATGQGWQQTGADGVQYTPFTNYTPIDGYYPSNNESIVQKQIQEMQYGNIQVGIASWWGQGSFTDQNWPTLFKAADDLNSSFRWAGYYETEGNGANPSAASITNDLNYLETHYATDASYFRINGKYVLFVYGEAGDACTGSSDYAQRWQAGNQGTGNKWYIVLKVFANYQTCTAQPQSWHQYGPAANTDTQGGYSTTISPGFWKKGDTAVTPTGSPRLVRDVGRWRNDVVNMTNANTQWHLITTWDEWGEGTAIEPANEFSSDSGYGQYLDILHRYTEGGTTVTTTAGSHTAPGAPTNVVASVVDANHASVTWTAPNNGGDTITSYTVTSSPGNHTATVSGSPAATTAVVAQLSPTAPAPGYTFTVTATNINGTGPASAPSNAVSTGSGANLPAAPTAPSIISVGNATVTVGWACPADPSGAPILDYTATSNPGGLTGTVAAPCNGFNTQTVAVNGLTNGTAYTFTIKARNVNGFGPASAPTASATPTGTASVPGAPGSVTASAGNAQATVSWSAPGNGGSAITSYTVTPFIGTVAQTATTVSGSPPPTNAVITGLTNGQSYTFKVAATNAIGTGAQSSASNAVTPTAGATVPGAPTGVSAVGGQNQATVSWTAPANNGGSAITGYTIVASDTTTKSVGVVTSAPITMAPGTYTFQVKACNNVGCSALSTASGSVTVTGTTTSSLCGSTAAAPTKYNHVIIIMMENHAWGSVGGVGFGTSATSSPMPFSYSMAHQCAAFATMDDTNTSENSLTEYMGITTGHNDTNWRSDCSPPASNCSWSGANIFGSVAGIGTVKNYVQSTTSTCNGDGGVRHVPSLYMWGSGQAGNGGSADHTKCTQQTVPLTDAGTSTSAYGPGPLQRDIDAGTLPTFGMITPNLTYDIHDGTLAGGDAFLKSWVTAITNGPNYKAGDTLVMMAFDEERPTPNFFIAPTTTPGVNTSCHYTQYGLFNDLSRYTGAPVLGTDGFEAATSCRAAIHT